MNLGITYIQIWVWVRLGSQKFQVDLDTLHGFRQTRKRWKLAVQLVRLKLGLKLLLLIVSKKYISSWKRLLSVSSSTFSTELKGDVLLVFSKSSTAAKWRVKISRQLCKYWRYWLQNFTVTLFHLYAKDDFNASLQWCRASHTAKSSLQNQPSNFVKLLVKSIFFPLF